MSLLHPELGAGAERQGAGSYGHVLTIRGWWWQRLWFDYLQLVCARHPLPSRQVSCVQPDALSLTFVHWAVTACDCSRSVSGWGKGTLAAGDQYCRSGCLFAFEMASFSGRDPPCRSRSLGREATSHQQEVWWQTRLSEGPQGRAERPVPGLFPSAPPRSFWLPVFLLRITSSGSTWGVWADYL